MTGIDGAAGPSEQPGPTSRLAPWRAVARLARRDVRRRPWRTALVVTLVGLPVAALTATVIVARTTHRTAAEERAETAGQADDHVETLDQVDEATFRASVEEAYPDGSRIVVVSTGPDGVAGDDGRLRGVERSDHPVDDPLMGGLLELTSGRAPERAGQVAVTPAVLEVTGARIGDRIRLELTGEAVVTGVVSFPADLDRKLVIGTTPPVSHPHVGRAAFVDLPPGSGGPDEAALDRIPAHNIGPVDGWIGADAPDLRGQLTALYVGGGVILAIAAIVAASAFAVGARRQLRTLGLLAASGASPVALRRMVLLQGTVTGVLGGVAGLVLGVGVAAGVHPLLDDITDRVVGPLDVRPLDLLGAALLGIAAATAAAWFPARGAARVPVLTALAGRRPAGRLPGAIPLAGLVVTLVGVVVLGVWVRRAEPEWGIGLAAALAVLFGTVAVAPWVVSHTEALARRLRGSARVAARDLARQRLRSAAVVAAVMAPAGLSVITAVSAATTGARTAAVDGRYLGDDEVEVSLGGVPEQDRAAVRAVGEALPEAAPVEIGEPTTEPGSGALDGYGAVMLQAGEPGPADPAHGSDQGAGSRTYVRRLLVVEPGALAEMGVPRRTIAALDAGQVVLTPPWPSGDVRVVGADAALEQGDVVRHQVSLPTVRGDGLISPATARRWGLDVVPLAVVFRNPEPLSAAQQRAVHRVGDGNCGWVLNPGCRGDALRAYLETGRYDASSVNLGVDQVADSDGRVLLHVGTVGGSLLFTLGVVAVALALTAAESRDERALLGAIGAGPEARRSMVAWQALLLPAMAVTVAVPVALLVGWVLQSEPHGSGVGPQVPWLTLALLVVALPLATAGAAWLGAALGGRRHRDLSALALTTD